ncbi:UDP-N-acetylmuramoyl-L-alanine--D-glutamate ligase [Parvimonas sp. G1967]|uniref:UDP-N-acetylmuramoyl-L-alanine--D-glutamate ligase n=1 Tax=Parvimonas sp. G1967 TaxID=3387695 RepID=UPI0039E2AB14
MGIVDKKVLVIGLGLSGISTIKTLSSLKAEVYCYDDKEVSELQRVFEELKNFNYKFIKNYKDYDFDFVVKSPGIKPSNEIIEYFSNKKVPIYTDLELAYTLFPKRKIIAITGTNGKTTTTSLVGEIFKTANIKSKVVGNIGIGMLWKIFNSDDETVNIIEVSSFQLHNIEKFKPFIASIGNITPDHIDWHGSFENYIEDKLKLFKNMDKDDNLILNIDDEILGKLSIENTNVTKISLISKNANFYFSENNFYHNDKKLFSMSDLKILGKHNAQNVLISVAICYNYGIDLDTIIFACKNFVGVEHRIEFVRELNGIKFYNDSKGTNVDSTIKAVEALEKPIILILGGYDKHVDFTPLFNCFNGKVKAIILVGDTKYKFYDTAKKNGFDNNIIVNDYREVVEKSFEIAEIGDNVLLSPASASWDMFKSYEERGNLFKKLVNEL